MSPTMKTRSFNVRSCKKSLPENKEKSSLAKKPSPKKIKSKPRVEQETPKIKKHRTSSTNSTSTLIKVNKNFKKEDVLITDKSSSKHVKLKPKKPSSKKVKQEIPKIKKEHVSLPPSAISANFTSTPIERNKNSKNEDVLITPTVMNPCLRSNNMHSPKYVNLRKQNKPSRKKAISKPRAKQEKPKIKKEHVSVSSAVSANLTSATNSTSAPIEKKKNSKKEYVLVTPLLTSHKKGVKSKKTPNLKKEHVSIPPSFAINENKNSKKENFLITPTVMNPCLKANKMHSSKYVSLKTKNLSSKKCISKPRFKQRKPMIKRERLSFSSTRSAHSTSAATSKKYTNLKPYTPVEQQIPMKERSYLTLPTRRYEVNFNSTPESARNNCKVTPSMLKGVMSGYKHSPTYFRLKNKMFNSDFKFAKPRGDMDIEIFTPEEEKSSFWTQNLPKIEKKSRGPPGELYADIFKNMPDLPDLSGSSDSDADIEKFDFDAYEEKLREYRKSKGPDPYFDYDGQPILSSSEDETIGNWDYIYDIKSHPKYKPPPED